MFQWRIEGAGFSGVGNTARGWSAALRGVRDNPLLNVWLRTEARRTQAKHWFRRGPGLISIAALLSLLVSAYLVSMIARWRVEPPGLIADLFAQTWAVGGTLAILYGVAIFALCWLTARLFTAARIALGFLEMEPRQRFSTVLDDMLAVTSLSPQEILTAVTGLCLRLLLPPLLLLSGVTVTVLIIASLCAGEVILQPDVRFPVSGSTTGLIILWGFQSWLKLIASGILAALLLVLISVTLGLLPRSGAMPVIGAGVLAILHLPVIAVGGLLMQAMPEHRPEIVYGAGSALGIALAAGLLVVLALYLARRLRWLQMTMGFAWPVLMLISAVVPYFMLIITYWDFSGYGDILAEQLWLMSQLALVNPFQLIPEHLLLGIDDPDSFVQWWRFPLGVMFQLVMVVVLAEFARDSVRRRFQGVSGE